MNNFDRVDTQFGQLRYMKRPQAEFLRSFITENHCSDILEIGFFHGKSSAYIAAIIEDIGHGHLTTIDKTTARKMTPNIVGVLEQAGLSHRVTPIFAERSHTWELGKMIRAEQRPQFDLCYFDGGHTWDVTGFGFLLVDMLLRPGGWIIFDDLDWTISHTIARHPTTATVYKHFSKDEKAAPGVGLVFDHLVPYLGYTDLRKTRQFSWGIARKPLA